MRLPFRPTMSRGQVFLAFLAAQGLGLYVAALWRGVDQLAWGWGTAHGLEDVPHWLLLNPILSSLVAGVLFGPAILATSALAALAWGRRRALPAWWVPALALAWAAMAWGVLSLTPPLFLDDEDGEPPGWPALPFLMLAAKAALPLLAAWWWVGLRPPSLPDGTS